jgi:Acetyltransferase (GNAT) domain
MINGSQPLIAALPMRSTNTNTLADTSSQKVHEFNPLTDCRWDVFVNEHPRASLFHSTAWLRALTETYGYQVVAYTTSPGGAKLKNAIVFCRVQSWITGNRLVSLPFSDHCAPLVDSEEDFRSLLSFFGDLLSRERFRYFEFRPLTRLKVAPFQESTTQYSFHELDLGPDIGTIFANFHKDSIQRKVRRAEREKLIYEEGRSGLLFDDFYQLLTLTRRRHRLPPQPRSWFEKLISCFGDDLKIRITRQNGRALAAMLTIRTQNTMVYKNGGSDPRFHNLGSMHLLYWNAIQEAKALGLRSFDFGRTDPGQDGLVTFKNRWGAQKSELTYSRCALTLDRGHVFDVSSSKPGADTMKELFAHLPNGVASFLGRILYKHVG